MDTRTLQKKDPILPYAMLTSWIWTHQARSMSVDNLKKWEDEDLIQAVDAILVFIRYITDFSWIIGTKATSNGSR